MGRKALQKKVNCLIDNDDMVPPENSKIASVKENLPTQHVEELIYRVECGDDSDVRNMMVSYKMHKKKLIEIYTLSKNYNIVMSTSLGEHDPRDNTSEEVNEVIMEEHELANSAVRSRSCCPLKVNGWKEIEQDKIDHMWDIILEKFNFDVSEGKRDAIFGHMSDLYRDYRYKLKRKYFDSKSTYQLRLRNKPKHFGADEWKYLVNLWSDADFQKRSLQNKTNRSKRSLPPYIGTKSYARLRHEMEKDGKTPSRVDVFMESRKRKKGKQVDAFQQDVIDQFDQFKKQQEKGEISLNDDDIFEKVLGTEKNGYLRAYGPGKSISEYFGGRPTKVQLIKQLESTRKESNERVEEVKREAKEQIEEMKKETDNKLEELSKRWEEKFQMMMAAQSQQSNDPNLTVPNDGSPSTDHGWVDAPYYNLVVWFRGYSFGALTYGARPRAVDQSTGRGLLPWFTIFWQLGGFLGVLGFRLRVLLKGP
ncbi:hypothetical protein KY290_001068 [Solanum tuberosum]|uniref:Transposase, Ptta/En/Spm, plant n=1 Tax=Solanum tuberosum TaxID=4113 RepID=A0ABQ7WNB6_SOLTU|nr:hypothetical protein KY290_001068 [Solanum tuberosum]